MTVQKLELLEEVQKKLRDKYRAKKQQDAVKNEKSEWNDHISILTFEHCLHELLVNVL